jgi:protein AATF/BFR2
MKGQLLKEIAALTAFGQDRTRDAEDDVFGDGTSAVLPGHDDGEGVGAGEWWVEGGKGKQEETAPAVRSQLRMAAGMAALEEAARYRGKKASRRALRWMEEEEEEEENEDGEEACGSESEEGEEEEGGYDDQEEAETSSSAADTSSDDDDEDDGDDDDDLEGEMARLRKDKQGMALLLKRSRDEQRHKAEEAKRHRDTWNRLLEVRILLQRLLGMGNRLPRAEAHDTYCRADPAVGEGFDGAASVLRGVLSQLAGLRRAQAAELEEEEEEGGKGGKRQRVVDLEGVEFTGPVGGRDDPWVATQGDYEACKAHWRRVLDAAHQRATLSVAVGKKFRVVNQGLWHQVEASLADRGRALRRSHLTRAQVKAAGLFVGGLGQGPKAGEEGQEAVAEEEEEEEEEPDEEAFDDAELYQLLLRDYIQSVGPAGGVDGVGATAALAGRGLSKRSKRKGVDTKASKGRKLRYAVHPKLEHFMFPVPPPPALMDVDRLFASLPGSSAVLGMRQPVGATSDEE